MSSPDNTGAARPVSWMPADGRPPSPPPLTTTPPTPFGPPAPHPAGPAYAGPPSPGLIYEAPAQIVAPVQISPAAWLAMSGGLLAFVASFLPAFTYQANCENQISLDICSYIPTSMLSGTVTVWGGGILLPLWCAALLLLLTAAVAAIKVFARQTKLTLPAVGMAMSAAALLLLLTGTIINPIDSSAAAPAFSGLGVVLTIEWTRALGFWLMLAFCAVAVVGAVLMVTVHQPAAPPIAHPVTDASVTWDVKP